MSRWCLVCSFLVRHTYTPPHSDPDTMKSPDGLHSRGERRDTHTETETEMDTETEAETERVRVREKGVRE